MAGADDFVEITRRDDREIVAIGMVEVEETGRTRGARRRFLRRVLGVVFHDDMMRLRACIGPANMALIRNAALDIFRRVADRASLKVRRKTAARDGDHLFGAINGTQ